MSKALIGYTGFVGGNINSQAFFNDKFNSKNIGDIDGKSYDLVVCSATRAEKWRINQEPEKDLDEIQSLIAHLKKVKTKKFVLISTVDVYKNPIDVDEDSALDLNNLHAYGRNRIYLENFCKENFITTIVRLPGLFGSGLKKNVIFDLLNGNNVDKIHPDGLFQYYNLDYIWKDIQKALDNNLKLINCATEPLKTSEIAESCFGVKIKNQPNEMQAGKYNMVTKNASLYGCEGKYLYSGTEVMRDIADFVRNYQRVL